MKVKVVKGSDAFVIIPLDFLCAPIKAYFENSIKSAILGEVTRTYFSLDKNLLDTKDYKVETSVKVGYAVKELPLCLFENVELPNKLIKEFKTLYLQNGFYFKSLTDNFTELESQNCVDSYVNSIVNTVKEFGGNIEKGGLMETVFNCLSFIDSVSDKSAFLLCITARLTDIAKNSFTKYGNEKHDPFLFNEENFIE